MTPPNPAIETDAWSARLSQPLAGAAHRERSADLDTESR